MYYPYLRGKQFELIALREFAGKNPKYTCPIIEPVKKNINSLISVIKSLTELSMTFSLVLNPSIGEYKQNTLELNDILPLLEGNNCIPTFILNDNSQQISEIISTFSLTDVMLIVGRNFDIDNHSNQMLIQNERIRYVVGSFDNNRALKRYFKSEGKEMIRLDDCFNEKQKNADYKDNVDELFSEEFNYYTEDGFSGFSDYTSLSSDFKEGGMLPKAVAIHMTYAKSDTAVFIHHFVSDSNDTTANIQKKFYEAATKLKSFFSALPTTEGVRSVIGCLDNNKYPGLGMLKKYSILNHLELMENILQARS